MKILLTVSLLFDGTVSTIDLIETISGLQASKVNHGMGMEDLHVNGYDQEIPQSHTTDQHTAP